jgi:hypothetical protein
MIATVSSNGAARLPFDGRRAISARRQLGCTPPQVRSDRDADVHDEDDGEQQEAWSPGVLVVPDGVPDLHFSPSKAQG